MPQAAIHPIFLQSSLGKPPTIIPERELTCSKCGATYRTPAPNRRPFCDNCMPKKGSK
jgi:hypothetical protein